MYGGTLHSKQDRLRGPGRALLLERTDAAGDKAPYGLLLSSHSQRDFSK